MCPGAYDEYVPPMSCKLTTLQRASSLEQISSQSADIKPYSKQPKTISSYLLPTPNEKPEI